MTIKKLKGNQIWFPKGTSYWVGHCSKPITRLIITSGGGMGGSRWNEYILPTEIHEGLNKVIDAITGKEFIVNSNYIVEAENFDLITTRYRCTNSNLRLKDELCLFNVYCDDADEVLFMDKYKDMDCWTY